MIVDKEELLISISDVKCSVSSCSLLVDLCVDVCPCFLITLKEIADWLCPRSPWLHLCRIKHELRGIELVRSIISQLVSVEGFFKGMFWNCEFDKNYMASNLFCFSMIMISLVISQLSCFRLAEIRWKGSSMKVLFICKVLD